jgi:hypothetical protein
MSQELMDFHFFKCEQSGVKKYRFFTFSDVRNQGVKKLKNGRIPPIISEKVESIQVFHGIR